MPKNTQQNKCEHEWIPQMIGGFPGHEHMHPGGFGVCKKCGAKEEIEFETTCNNSKCEHEWHEVSCKCKKCGLKWDDYNQQCDVCGRFIRDTGFLTPSIEKPRQMCRECGEKEMKNPSPKLAKEQTKLDLESEIFIRLYYALPNVNVGIAVNSMKDLIEKLLADQKKQIVKEFTDDQRCLSCGDYKETGILTGWCDKCLETK